MSASYSRDLNHPKGIGGSPIRRRRFTLFAILLLGLVFFIFVPWELPPSLKGVGFSSISRASVAQLMKSKKVEVDEIYGLLHLVTGDNEQEHVLSNAVHLDPTEPLELSVYAAGDTTLDWGKEYASLNKDYPIVVFSKTYCPFSQRAKALLEAYDIQPPPKVIEVDIRDDGNVIKHLLTRLTHHSTFPNIIIRGRSIGGSDELQKLHANKTLTKLLEDAGAKPKSDGSGK
ncbi:thioredoxin-like protein [Crassisporium funariophilum]|nr:thioredoxin-like protein [Crassisporium funariophilum]